jgi:hypothetical protein
MGEDMAWWQALCGKTVQIDTLTHRQIDRSKKGLADPSPFGQRGIDHSHAHAKLMFMLFMVVLLVAKF